ncbi:MAG: oligosaccharide flippase family protein [Deltaproteobacteria bacterium]|nr:oligosaccharide flippase family protein [Deltaproteobacteria bacterium]
MTPTTRTLSRSLLAALLGSSLLRNLSAVALLRVLNVLLTIATFGYAARALGPECWGEYNYGASVAAYAGILISPGLMTWGLREVARDRSRSGRLAVLVNSVQLGLATPAFVAVAVYSAALPEKQRHLLLVMSSVLFTQALDADWVIAGGERLHVTAITGSVLVVAQTLALVTLIRSPDDLTLYALFPVMLGLARFAVAAAVLRRSGVRLERPTVSEYRRAIVASLPLGAAGIFTVVAQHGSRLVVHGLLGDRQLGMFAVALQLLAGGKLVTGILSTVFLPRLSRLFAEDRPLAVREAGSFLRLHLAVGFLLAAALAADAEGIVGLIYGNAYFEAVPLVRWTALPVIFHFAVAGYTEPILAAGEDRALARIVFAIAAVTVGGSLLLVPRLGVLGATLALGCADATGWLSSVTGFRRLMGSAYASAWLTPVLGAAVAAAAMVGLRRLGVPLLLRDALASVPFLVVFGVEARRALGYRST